MTDDLARVRDAYGARAGEYTDAVGRIEHAAAADRRFVRGWAETVSGLVLDVGCGPGQWTHDLAAAGVDVIGIDPVPEFIRGARAAYPDNRFLTGRAEELPFADESVGGVLSWYSLIHMAPAEVPRALGEFARVLAPGGSLALGFFVGSALEPFDHAIVTAHRWPLAELAAAVAAASLAVTATETRTDAGARPHGAILAVR